MIFPQFCRGVSVKTKNEKNTTRQQTLAERTAKRPVDLVMEV